MRHADMHAWIRMRDCDVHGRHSAVVHVGKVNSAVSPTLSARFAIQSAPTLFVIKGDTAYRYTGALSRDSVAQCAKDGHKNDDSLPLWSSPMGPFGKIKGLMIKRGLKLWRV